MKLSTFYHIRWLGIPFLTIELAAYQSSYKIAAISFFIAICIIGAVLGVIVQFYHLPGKCDLCGRKAHIIAKYQEGFGNRIMMRCVNCGLIVNSAQYGVKIEKYDDELPG